MSEQPTDIDEWIKSLYDPATNHVYIEYGGMKLTFQKRFQAGLALSLQNKPQDEQIAMLISILSVNPRFTPAQAKQLPMDLFGRIAQELELDPEIYKKKV